MDIFSGPILSAFEGAIQSAIVQGVDIGVHISNHKSSFDIFQLNQLLADLPMLVPVSENMELNYALSMPPYFGADYITLGTIGKNTYFDIYVSQP